MSKSFSKVTTMSNSFPKVFFVTGTDTDVGKTVVSAILALGLSAHYWKPVQSGISPGIQKDGSNTLSRPSCRQSTVLNSEPKKIAELNSTPGAQAGSLQRAQEAAQRIAAIRGKRSAAEALTDSEFLTMVGVEPDFILPERYLLSRPLSPHLAARLDGKTISLNDFSLPDTSNMNHLIVEGAGGLLVPLNEHDKVIDLIVHLDIPALLVARSELGTINHTLLSLAALRERSIDIIGVVMTGETNEENRKAIEQFGNVDVIAEIPVLPNLQRSTLLECFAEYFYGGLC